MVGVTLDPYPLFAANDREYATLFALVTNATIEEHNRMQGGS